jgi:putative ABC transport system permease protein
MILFRLKRTLLLGIKSLWLHKLRTLLTMLGMVLGVAAVIVMLAIGEGASYEAQQQIKALGSTNIILRSVKPPEDTATATDRQHMPSYGLTYADAAHITGTLPDAQVLVPMRSLRKKARNHIHSAEVFVQGTVPWMTEVLNRKVESGRFIAEADMDYRAGVCVLDPRLAQNLFPLSDPIGMTVKVENHYYHVIGVLAPTGLAQSSEGETSGRANMYLPLTTLRKHFGEIILERSSGTFKREKVELHQLTVHVETIDQVMPTAKALRTILARNHKRPDYEIIIPLEQLKAAEKVKRTFNFVLGSIAFVSLIVGGIGIMNIMLATVTERTREIGIRRALGAKKRDIVVQFLSETVLLSTTGGFIGLGLGIGAPPLVERLLEKPTIVTLWSMAVAFSLSVSVGIISGIYPAYRAANMNPIEALRHE